MAQFQHDDPLLQMLRDARPEIDETVLSPRRPEAAALLSRIIAGDRLPSPAVLDGRGRRRSRGAVLAFGSAAAAAVVLVLGGLAAAGAFSGGPASTAGGVVPGRHAAVTLDARTVLSRSSAAIGQADTADIGYVVTTSTSSSGAVTASYRQWAFPAGQGLLAQQLRIEVLNADGTPKTDDSWVTSDGRITGRVVSYPLRAWFATSQQEPALPAHGPADRIRQAVQSGLFRVIGTQMMGGQQAIELSDTHQGAASPLSPAGTVQDTLWVSAASYLPLQETVSYPGGAVTGITTSWLAPSTANLALLQAPVPAGFSQLPGPPGPGQ